MRKRQAVILTAAMILAGGACGANFQVTPYLQHPATDAMSILWFANTSDSATLRWWPADGGSVSSAVVSGVRAVALTNNVCVGETTVQCPTKYRYRHRLTGLATGTRYAYAVELAGGVAYTNTFKTAPGPDSPVRFMYYNDSETKPNNGITTDWPYNGGNYYITQTEGYRQGIARMKSRKPDLYVVAGDLASQGGRQRSWDEYWKHNAGGLGTGYDDPAGSSPILAAIGNHDLQDCETSHWKGTGSCENPGGGESALERFLSYFEYEPNGVDFSDVDGRDRSQMFHRTDYGPVTFIFLDTNNGDDSDPEKDTNTGLVRDPAKAAAWGVPSARSADFNPGSRQYAWLTNQLADAQAKAKFTFVVNHQCPYSAGYHNRTNLTESGEWLSARAVRVLGETMIRYGVDGWLCGHDEMMEHARIAGNEILPDGTTRPHTVNIFDMGTIGNGLRGGYISNEGKNLVATQRVYGDGTEDHFRAYRDEPAVWENGVLVAGGVHYTHMEVNVREAAPGLWTCTMEPNYYFTSNVNGTVGSAWRTYDDVVVLTNDLNRGTLCRTADVYLEGTANSCIDTGCTVGPNTRIIADIEYEAPASGSYTHYLWGATGGRNEYAYLQNGDAKVAFCNNGGKDTVWCNTPTLGSGVRCRVDCDIRTGSFANYAGLSSFAVGGCSGSPKAGTVTSTGTLQIFSFKKGSEWWGGASLFRVYSFQIYENNALVRDLVPFGYGSQTGLVDRLTGKVYTDIRNNSRKFKIGWESGSARCPVRNIYLDTGYTVNSKTKLEIDFALDASVDNQRVFSCEGGSGVWGALYQGTDGFLYRNYADGALAPAKLGSEKAHGARRVYTLDVPGNSETVAFPATATKAARTLYSGALVTNFTQEASVPLALCCQTSLSGTTVTPVNFGSVRIFSCRIWDDGTLVRDYVPCVRDNLTGLFDKVNGTFLTATKSRNRVNELDWRGHVETECVKGRSAAANGDAYLESHNNEVISTGYCTNPKTRLEAEYQWVTIPSVTQTTEYLLGNTAHLGVYGQIYSKGDAFATGTYRGGWGASGFWAKEERERVVIDVPEHSVTYYAGSSTAVAKDTTFALLEKAWTTTSSIPLTFFAQGLASGYGAYAGVRLYSCKVYEDNVLVHAYYPDRAGGAGGLRDLVTGTFFPKTAGSGTLALGGGGCEGQGFAFVQNPIGRATAEPDHPVTLTAFAAGAENYLWYKNGQPIDGATSGTLTVNWRSTRSGQASDTFKCVARFPNWGYAESSATEIRYAGKGYVIQIR